MELRAKLRATVVGKLGDEDLSETVTAATIQRTMAPAVEPRDPTDVLPRIGDVIDDTYRLVSRLGEGMFGSVYVAERTDVPEHRVALKVINRVVYAGRNPERELVMLAAATHPNIVELKDHGMTEDYVWLTMPLYAGETLHERLKREPLGLEEAYDIFVPVARGLEALHVQGLRHQDIKPENIYLAKFASQIHPVLLDLGVAVENDAPFVAGTVLFGAPEQVAALARMGDPGVLSEKMDTYCIASTLLYALVGREHFAGVKAKTPLDMVDAFETRETHPIADDALPDVQGKAREVLMAAFSRWLTRDPEARPTAGELADELDVLLERQREAEREVRRGLQRQKQALQRFRLATLGVLTVIAAIAFYAYSQRKTLSLASKLRAAEQEGAAAFEELGECKTAYAHVDQQRRACNESSAKATGELSQRLASVESNARQTQAAMHEQITAGNAKLKSCEETKTELDETFSTEKTAWEEARKKLEADKAELEGARASCDASVDRLLSDHASCKSDLASCLSRGRDIYDNPAGAPPPPAPAPDNGADSVYGP